MPLKIKYPYKAIKVGGRRIDEHRYVMEQILGRRLLRAEIVRHRDKNLLNNVPENLYIVTRKQQFQEQINEGSMSQGRGGKAIKIKVKKEKPSKPVKVKKEKKGLAVKSIPKSKKVFEMKEVDTSRLTPLRLDRKTIVYVKPNISPKEIDRIIGKHKNYINVHLF